MSSSSVQTTSPSSASISGDRAKQTLIVHYFPSIPSFDQIGTAVIRNKKDGRINFVESVRRVRNFITPFLRVTPQHGYELLNSTFESDIKIKFDNMERFGDSQVRIVAAIIVCNYLNQIADFSGAGEMEGEGASFEQFLPSASFPTTPWKGIVLVMEPSSLEVHLDTLAMFAAGIERQAVVFLPRTDSLSLLQIAQIHACKESGATLIVHTGDITACLKAAREYAKEHQYVFIDQKFSHQFGLLGAATAALEILTEQPNTQTLIMPSRIYEVDFIMVTGMAVLAKTMKPTLRLVLARLDEGEDPLGKQGLFPDALAIGWKTLLHPAANLITLYDVLDKVDVNNPGLITRQDLLRFVASLGPGFKGVTPALDRESLNLSTFVHEVHLQYRAQVASALAKDEQLRTFVALKSLQAKGYIDEIVTVNETEAAMSFQRCLEYTHTQADGKGVLALAALWARKVSGVKGQFVVAYVSGGFVDLINFQPLLDCSMSMDGNNFTLSLELVDTTSALSSVLSVVAQQGISVYDVTFDRTGGGSTLGFVRVFIQCLSKSFDAQARVFDLLRKEGYTLESKLQPPQPPIIDSPESAPPLKPSDTYEHTHVPETVAVRDISEVTPESIRAANALIANNIIRTPIYYDRMYSNICGCKLFLKFENIQKTGSFKVRGSSNMVLKAVQGKEKRPLGLVAASAGNHAQGVALISSKVGLPCTIVCPTYAPETKLRFTRKYGAEVLKSGNAFEEAVEAAENIGRDRGWLLVRPFNDVDIIEGQGTMGLEIAEDIPDVDTVLVNVGGGGMIAGIATYLKGINPKVRIVGIQSEVVAPLVNFKETATLKPILAGVTTLADGVNVRVPGGVHSRILKDLVDEYVTVSENEIAATIVHLLSASRTLSEGAGCLGLAALLHKKIKVRPEEKVCVVLCGGNIDMSTLKQIYEYGLRSLGRFFTVHVRSSDSPGNLAKVVALAAQSDLKVHEVRHIRGLGDINWNEVTLSLSFYSHSFQHQIDFLVALTNQAGKSAKVVGREFLKNHETIYAAFDQVVAQKQAEMQPTKISLDSRHM